MVATSTGGLEGVQCPLWVKSGHMQCKKACPLSANSGHNGSVLV